MKNNLIFALDVPNISDAKFLVRELKDEVGCFKVGLELFIQEGPGIVDMIRKNSDAEVFLDLKLHDIPTTVERAIESASRLGVDYLTVHARQGVCMRTIDNVKILAVTILTSEGRGSFDLDTFKQRLAWARLYGAYGIICSGLELKEDVDFSDLKVFVPGIRPWGYNREHDDQKRIVTPAQAFKWGAHAIIVGRPIRDAGNPKEAAQKILRSINGKD